MKFDYQGTLTLHYRRVCGYPQIQESMALTAIGKRVVLLEMEENVTAMKAAVDAVDTTLGAMTLRGIDGDLPTDAATKQALAAYDAISKPVMGITDALADVRAVVIP